MEDLRQLLLAMAPQLAAPLADALESAWLAGAALSVDALAFPPGEVSRLEEVDGQGGVSYPVALAAAHDLAARELLTREEYEGLSAEAREQAMVITGLSIEGGLVEVQRALVEDIEAGGTLDEFGARLAHLLLAPHRLETIYRTNVAAAYSRGLVEVLDHPMVSDEFPYLEYHATHDSRTRHDHLALEHQGLDGTGVYRRDDPVWRQIMPPNAYNCRCVAIPLSLEDAAARGVREAQRWLATGQPPDKPQWVEGVAFDRRGFV